MLLASRPFLKTLWHKFIDPNNHPTPVNLASWFNLVVPYYLVGFVMEKLPLTFDRYRSYILLKKTPTPLAMPLSHDRELVSVLNVRSKEC